MKLTKEDYFEGRKIRKSLDGNARKNAKKLIAGTIGGGTDDLADARAIMSTYYSMKAKNIDSIIMQKPLVGAWVVVLTFKDLPRGVPNFLGAPGKPKSKEAAEKEAQRLLLAAHVKCEDTKVLMRAGKMDDLRLFRFQQVHLQVPGEMVDAAAKKMPEGIAEKEMAKLRKEQIDKMHKAAGPVPMTVDRWNTLEEDTQLQIMVPAAFLLCLNINLVA
jgi:hypothetical protein